MSAALLEAARALVRAGDPAATKAYRQVLVQSPECIEAHVALADLAEAHGQAGQALVHRQHACRLRPTDPELLFALGETARTCGFADDALKAWRFALHLAPSHPRAMLRIAQAMEREGHDDEAARLYFRALVSAQLDGHWLDESTTPARWRDDVRHAAHAVETGRARILGGLLQPLVERFGVEALRRVHECLEGYLTPGLYTPGDAQQRPKFLYFPGLPESPYLPRERFPWFGTLEACTAAIRDEARAVLRAPDALTPFLEFGPGDDAAAYLAGEAAPPRWDAFFFYRHGEPFKPNAAKCPRTWDALQKVPLARIGGHAPEVCFSVLAPGTRILPHHGVTNVRCVVHLPLVVPAGCVLTVGGQEHPWREGECVAFDDTWLHEARNASDETRVILLMDAWNPWLTGPEQQAIATLVEGIGAFNRG